MTNKFLMKNSGTLYFVFRVLIGLVFFLHGMAKWPGMTDGTIPIFGLMGLAGVIETVAGILLVLGLWVRPTALVAGIEMLVAFFYIHVASQGTLNPLQNGGEAALLFFAAFLVLMGHGAGKWAIDKKNK